MRQEENVPVSLAGAVLLGLLGVGIDGTMLGEVLGDVFLRSGGAVSQSGVGSVVELVGASHCQRVGGVSRHLSNTGIKSITILTLGIDGASKYR